MSVLGAEKANNEHFDLDREDILLLLLEANERLLGKPFFKGITRLEKLVFLLANETSFSQVKELFEFKPHHFGPFSKEIYEGTDFLEGCNLLNVKEKGYSSYFAHVEESELAAEIDDDEVELENTTASQEVSEKQFILTPEGRKVAQIIRNYLQMNKTDEVKDLDKIVIRYGNLPLSQLIRFVYKRYPDMAVKSIHPAANDL